MIRPEFTEFERLARQGNLVPVYETVEGWNESTLGVRDWNGLPENARRYIERIAEMVGVGIDIVSTGPDRNETIILRDPFAGF